MEIYKELTSPAAKEFETLLNNQLSKTKVEENKIVKGKITKINLTSDKKLFDQQVIDREEFRYILVQGEVLPSSNEAKSE